MSDIGHCPINHPLCTPRACAGCNRLFCLHDPTCHSVGYYGQFHSPECRERKLEAIQQLALPKMHVGEVAFVIEPEWSYLVCHPGGEYEYRILSQESSGYSGPLYNFCSHLDQRHVVAYRHEVTIAVVIFLHRNQSMWAITSLHLHASQVDRLSVGGSPIVVIHQDT